MAANTPLLSSLVASLSVASTQLSFNPLQSSPGIEEKLPSLAHSFPTQDKLILLEGAHSARNALPKAETVLPPYLLKEGYGEAVFIVSERHIESSTTKECPPLLQQIVQNGGRLVVLTKDADRLSSNPLFSEIDARFRDRVKVL